MVLSAHYWTASCVRVCDALKLVFSDIEGRGLYSSFVISEGLPSAIYPPHIVGMRRGGSRVMGMS